MTLHERDVVAALIAAINQHAPMRSPGRNHKPPVPYSQLGQRDLTPHITKPPYALSHKRNTE